MVLMYLNLVKVKAADEVDIAANVTQPHTKSVDCTNRDISNTPG